MEVISSGFEDLLAKVEEATRAEAAGDAAEAKSTLDRGSEDTREAYVVDADTITAWVFVDCDISLDAAVVRS